MPLGKEGPFVHIASIVSSLLSRVVNKFQKSDGNQSRNSETSAAGPLPSSGAYAGRQASSSSRSAVPASASFVDRAAAVSAMRSLSMPLIVRKLATWSRPHMILKYSIVHW